LRVLEPEFCTSPQPLLARWAAAASAAVDDFLRHMSLDGARAQGIAAAGLAIILT
jgi:hypothetical protein